MTTGKTGTRQACLQKLIQEGKKVIGYSNLFGGRSRGLLSKNCPSEARSYVSSLGLGRVDGKRSDGT